MLEVAVHHVGMVVSHFAAMEQWPKPLLHGVSAVLRAQDPVQHSESPDEDEHSAPEDNLQLVQQADVSSHSSPGSSTPVLLYHPLCSDYPWGGGGTQTGQRRKHHSAWTWALHS